MDWNGNGNGMELEGVGGWFGIDGMLEIGKNGGLLMGWLGCGEGCRWFAIDGMLEEKVG